MRNDSRLTNKWRATISPYHSREIKYSTRLIIHPGTLEAYRDEARMRVPPGHSSPSAYKESGRPAFISSYSFLRQTGKFNQIGFCDPN